MEEGIFWIKNVLEILKEQFPDEKNVPNVTLPVSDNDRMILAFSFFHKDKWIGFAITKRDMGLSPEELVEEVRMDLNIN
jgi:hypothetical protein